MTNEKTSRDPSRRKFIKYGVAAAGATALGLTGYSFFGKQASSGSTVATTSSQIAGLTRTRTMTTARSSARRPPPVKPTRIDVHDHPETGPPADEIIRRMDKAGVSHIALMCFGAFDNITYDIFKQYPNRIIPFIGTKVMPTGEYYPEWLSEIDKVLRPTGDFYGVGEVLLRYYHNQRGEPECNAPADSPSIKKLADTISANDAVLLIHLNPEIDATRSLDNLLTYNKEVKLIWAHLGSVGRAYKSDQYSALKRFNEMMSKHENLYADISSLDPFQVDGLTPIPTDQGVLTPEFKETFQEYNDRIMFGLDCCYVERWDEQRIIKSTKWYDDIMANLDDPKMGENIMWRNAVELLKL